MDMTVWIWLLGIVAFVILESATYQLISIWFAIGAVGGLIAKACGAGFVVQLSVFIAVSALCIICLRPLSKKLIKGKEVKTNADALVGKEVLVTKEINNLRGEGEGRVGGMTWTLRSVHDETIAAGETVICEKIEGVKLMVKRKED